MRLYKRILRTFIEKNGEVSKTAIFLSLGVLILLVLWPFQTLFGSVQLAWWLVPEFNVGAATAVMSILSTLYVLNHSKFIKKDGVEGLQEAKQLVDSGVNTLKKDS